MSETHKIGRVALYVELSGQVALVALDQDKLRAIVDIAASMCEDGILRVMKQPDSSFCSGESLGGDWKAVEHKQEPVR